MLVKRRSKISSSKAFAKAIPFGMNLGSSASILFVGFALGMIILSSVRPDAVEGIRAKTLDIFSPVIQLVSVPVQSTTLMLRDVSGLATMQAENQRLAAENERLREWYQTALMLQAENKSLRELLSVKAEPTKTFLTARVLSDSGNAFAKTLLLAAGSNDGVQKGQAVMAGQGLIGRVMEVGNSASRVLLITDINSRVPVIVDETSQHAILVGDNKRAATLMHVPPETRLSEGAKILTSGFGGVYPPGLAVGTVKLNEQGAITINPLAKMQSLTHVRLIEQMPDPYLRKGALLSQ